MKKPLDLDLDDGRVEKEKVLLAQFVDVEEKNRGESHHQCIART